MSHTILVVDDSLPMRAVIKKMIKASGYGSTTFFEAGNGREALEVMGKNWMDLVVTDYNMPGMNGIEMLAEMKKDDILEEIPVLVITTEGSEEKVNQFLEMGARGYLKKPFKPEEIYEKLVTILGENYDDQENTDGAEDLDF